MIHIILLAVLVARATPTPHSIPVATHNAECDRLTDQRDQRAGDVCLQAADEWGQVAAQNSHSPDLPHIELLGAACRVQAAWAFHRRPRDYRDESHAFDQMMLAASIAFSVGKPSHDPYVRAFAASIAHQAYVMYPSAFEKVP
jgi:hypothetical protein